MGVVIATFLSKHDELSDDGRTTFVSNRKMKNFIRHLILVIGLIPLANCTTANKKSDSKIESGDPTQGKASKLFMAEANERGNALQNIHYRLKLNLANDGDTFQGHLWSEFERTSKTIPLFFDFQNSTVIAYFVNGTPVTSPEIKNEKLIIPSKYLKMGENRIEITYEGHYSHEGNGLYRFKDPVDNKIYVYTDFEPYQASQLFPCFDQPDLKAHIAVEVTVPGDWQVISTTRETKTTMLPSGQQIWTFPETPKLSTYVFAVQAGPYKVWTSKAGKIPLRLFARQSLAQYVDANEWFDTTKKGFEFYAKYFNYPYPFKKYDQIIVPDFNWGGMENIAAVSYAERYISRGVKTKDDKERLANVILHEMAHMWFGDLVTMKWWNDLWLNESFASYMATYSLAEATSFKDSWVSFFGDDKTWGYWEDQLVTTHPIEAVVPDTSQALANFDGISYGKGASVMKQLSFYVGAEAFQKGVQNYFKKFQYGNTQRKDFVNEVALASGKNLEDWSRLWLTKADVDQIKAVWSCGKNGKVDSFKIEQNPPAGEQEFRPHRTEIGFYSKNNGDYNLFHHFAMTYQGKDTDIPDLKGQRCPDLVIPNEGDYDYAVALLDDQSIKNLKTGIGHVKNPLARLIFWNSLYEMVRTADLPVQEFAKLLLREMPKEKHPNIQKMFRHRYLPSVSQYFAQTTPAEIKLRAEYVNRLELILWQNAQAAAANSDDQKEFLDSYINLSETPESAAKLSGLLSGQIALKGFKIDQDRRWKMIRHLEELSSADADTFLAAEKITDSTERGQQAALSADAARPNQQVKNNYISQIIADDTQVSQSRMRAILYSMYPKSQDSLRRQQASSFYKNLEKLLEKRTDTFLETYTDSIAPFTCDEASLSEATQFIADHPKMSAIALKSLKVSRQEAERCKKIRGRSAAALAGVAAAI